MPDRLILSGGEIVLYEGIMHDGAVVIRGNTIESICHKSEIKPGNGDKVIDCSGLFVCPGFIDLHNQGGGGFSVMDGSMEHIEGMCRVHASHGTTSLLLTPAVDTAGHENLLPKLAACVGKETGGASILGIHAEGPFLNPRRRGCMPLKAIQEPDRASLDRILELGNGTIVEMTIAPELPGALDLIRLLADEGIVPSLGHSDATLDDVLRATDYGASHVTHFFNAMSGLHHREPGLVGSALYSSDLSVELVADGFHVHPWILGLTVHTKGIGRTCLVTDAMPELGMPDGDYESLAGTVTLSGGRLSLAGDSAVLAGSVLTLDRAVANMVSMVGFSLPDAVAMASTSPAAVLGIDHRKGRLEAGFDADIALLDKRYNTVQTIVGGAVVFNRLPSGLTA